MGAPVKRAGDEMWVVAPDMPGFGKSAALRPPTTAHVDQYAKALADWAKGEGIAQLMLAGHSMGGYVAFAFARKYPEMLHSLILVATRPGADNEAGREGRYKTAGAVEERGAVAAADAMLPKLFAPEAYEEKKELVESVRAMILRQSEEGIIGALYAMASRPELDARPGGDRGADAYYYGGAGRYYSGGRSAEYAGTYKGVARGCYPEHGTYAYAGRP